ncbi:MAG TPA: hypothetical protein VKV39_01505 [Candidatus Sulfotelmatobacter sp.]|nr:hypothetical protein [Candidatus Sulfotelmatobacter sp.]
MGGSALRKLASCVLVISFPLSLFAADSNAAMLYTKGPAWVNGSHVPHTSSAIFSGDLLQTPVDSVAKINEPGSTITVSEDSLVKFDPSSMEIEHGGVTVSTSRSVSTSAGDVKVTPASNSWTEFNVVDTDGTVKIAARKGDLTITDGKEVFTLAQGQETTRDETAPENQDKKKNKKAAAGTVPGANGGLLNSPLAVGIGGAAIVGITTWVLVKSDDPASPSKPQ